MHTHFPPSELILNPDGSIYHLNLRPEDIGSYIFTVGDPHRVPKVSQYFDRIDTKREKREFVTHTGELGNKRVSVISTGIGPDNIDIVFNELDALVNIDLATRALKPQLTQLNFIRLGTSGCLRPDVPVDNVVCSALGLSLDNLLQFYQYPINETEQRLATDWSAFLAQQDIHFPVQPQAVMAGSELYEQLRGDAIPGITFTCPGFYAPQARHLRAPGVIAEDFFDRVADFASNGISLTNLEMETGAIYGLSRILGHQAVSFSAILANRATNTFSAAPKQAVDRMIRQVIDDVRGL